MTSKQVIALPDSNGDGVSDYKVRQVLVTLETKQDYAHSQLLGPTFHRSGEVIDIAPWYGGTAGGGPNKAELIKRLQERKRLRDQ